jgi:hypothetical protein
MSQHEQPSDEEFEAFLRGKGRLPGDLQTLQIEPPAALSAAILEAAAARMAAERDKTRWSTVASQANAGPANDAHNPDQRFSVPPQGYSLRKRALYAAIAASIIGAVSIKLYMQDTGNATSGTDSGTAPLTVAQAPEAVLPAALPVPSGRTVTPQSSTAPVAADSSNALSSTAKKEKQERMQLALNEAAQAKAEKRQPENGESRREAERVGASPPPNNGAKDAAQENDTSLLAQAPIAPPPPASAAPAPAPAAPAAPAASRAVAIDDTNAKVWLNAIEEEIDAGKLGRARTEWARFQQAHPHYVVPANLADKIKSLKEPQP